MDGDDGLGGELRRLGVEPRRIEAALDTADLFLDLGMARDWQLSQVIALRCMLARGALRAFAGEPRPAGFVLETPFHTAVFVWMQPGGNPELLL